MRRLTSYALVVGSLVALRTLRVILDTHADDSNTSIGSALSGSRVGDLWLTDEGWRAMPNP